MPRMLWNCQGSREGVGGSHGRSATGTDEGIRPYTSLLGCARYFYAFGIRRVARDAFVEGFGDLLAVAVAAEFLFVGGTGHERDFRQNSWHGAFGEDDESGFFDAAVA